MLKKNTVYSAENALYLDEYECSTYGNVAVVGRVLCSATISQLRLDISESGFAGAISDADEFHL